MSGQNSQPAFGSILDEPGAGPQQTAVGRFMTVDDDVRIVLGRRVHPTEYVLEQVEGVFLPIHKGHGDRSLLQ